MLIISYRFVYLQGVDKRVSHTLESGFLSQNKKKLKDNLFYKMLCLSSTLLFFFTKPLVLIDLTPDCIETLLSRLF